jgi:hypothetical protein
MINTGQYIQNKHIHIPNIHAMCGIRIHDPGFRASEDSTCLRPLGYLDRLRYRLEDNIKQSLKEIGCDGVDWINLAQGGDQWRGFVCMVMNPGVV